MTMRMPVTGRKKNVIQPTSRPAPAANGPANITSITALNAHPRSRPSITGPKVMIFGAHMASPNRPTATATRLANSRRTPFQAVIRRRSGATPVSLMRDSPARKKDHP